MYTLILYVTVAMQGLGISTNVVERGTFSSSKECDHYVTISVANEREQLQASLYPNTDKLVYLVSGYCQYTGDKE